MENRRKIHQLLVLNNSQHKQEIRQVFQTKLNPTNSSVKDAQSRSSQGRIRMPEIVPITHKFVPLNGLRRKTRVESYPEEQINTGDSQLLPTLRDPMDHPVSQSPKDNNYSMDPTELLKLTLLEDLETSEPMINKRMDAYVKLRLVAQLIQPIRDKDPRVANTLTEVNDAMQNWVRQEISLCKWPTLTETQGEGVANNVTREGRMSAKKHLNLGNKVDCLRTELAELTMERDSLQKQLESAREEKAAEDRAPIGDERDYSKHFELDQLLSDSYALDLQNQHISADHQKNYTSRTVFDHLMAEHASLLASMTRLEKENKELSEQTCELGPQFEEMIKKSEMEPEQIERIMNLVETGDDFDLDEDNEKRWNWYIS